MSEQGLASKPEVRALVDRVNVLEAQLRDLLDHRYHARAYRSATIVGLTASAWTTLVLDAVNEDADLCYNSVTGIYTVKRPGLYSIDYGGRLYNRAGVQIDVGLRIALNATVTLLNDFRDRVPPAVLGGNQMGKPGKRRLAVSDTLQLQYYVTNAACDVIGGDGVTWMAVTLERG